MSDRQTLSTMELLHASIVRPDGTVPAIDRSPSPWWRNSQEATRGEYRDDQHAGVDNSVQPTRGEPRCGGHGDLPLHGDVHAPGNRQPSDYPHIDWLFIRQARVLALWGFEDEFIAEVMGTTLAELAYAAWDIPELLEAITPAPEDIEARRAERLDRNSRRSAARRDRLAGDPAARIRNSVSARLWAALKGKTDGALFRRLGYSLQELTEHLQGLFAPGMSWDNYGKWHVDHVQPCASFDMTDPEQFRACWALGNLQPLWAADNIRKGARTCAP
ncbi:hypothetical protein [Stenotrophomonas maltophilia]|uniref:hypothetical protein n=1 Tax=Stenotrophomonas maltophilia TaxID=40324 RepID=UPI000F659B9F|nr:hypothetical protein [Stenotrophomonas maltophilia]RRU74140.1 hypothetical protein EGJ89_07420 [Stenotrophomonas maltophilia]